MHVVLSVPYQERSSRIAIGWRGGTDDEDHSNDATDERPGGWIMMTEPSLRTPEHRSPSLSSAHHSPPQRKAQPNRSVLVPLTDPGGAGLYPIGNEMPIHHRNAAPVVKPIDGVIGIAALGMSNGLQEWARFTTLANARRRLNPSVVIANGAVRGLTMRDWIDPRNEAWHLASEGIAATGLEPRSVQVVWLKMGSKLSDLGHGDTNERVDRERGWLTTILEQAVEHLPNLRQAFVTSRSYAAYGTPTAHLEPVTGFDNGLAVKALVADAVAGATPVWTAWGPYLWANGATPRIDGHRWERRDFETDGIHPSPLGEQKAGRLLLEFFASEPLTQSWWSAESPEPGHRYE